MRPARTEAVWVIFVASFALLPFDSMRVLVGVLHVPIAAGLGLVAMVIVCARLVLSHEPVDVDWRILLGLTMMLVGNGLSVAVAKMPDLSLWLLAKWLFHSVLFIFLLGLQDRVWHLRAILTLVFVTGALSAYGVHEYLQSESWDVNFYAGIGTRNATGLHIALVLPMGLALAVTRAIPWWVRWVLWGATAASLIALVFTYNRAAWLAVLAALVVLVLTGRRPATLLLLAIAIVFLGYLGPPGVQERFWSIFSLQESHNSAVTNALRLRLQTLGVHVIMDHPFLGVGLGNFVLEVPWYQYNFLSLNANVPHNFYLRVWAEGGLLAFVGFLTTAVLSLRRVLRGLSESRKPIGQAVLKGTLASHVALFLFLLFSDDFNNILAWTILGLGAAATRLWVSEPLEAGAAPSTAEGSLVEVGGGPRGC